MVWKTTETADLIMLVTRVRATYDPEHLVWPFGSFDSASPLTPIAG